MTERLRWVSLISGGGSTMAAIVRASQPGGELAGLIESVGVVASRPEAGGIEIAREHGIPVKLLSRAEYPKGDSGLNKYGDDLLDTLRQFAPDVVTLNGFLVRVSPAVIAAYEQRIFNQHPGPVPEFGGPGMYGRRVHAAVVIFNRLTRREDPHTVVIAQRVAVDFDAGAVVAAAAVPVLPADTVEDLAARALPAEHGVQIELLSRIAGGRVREQAPPGLAKPGESVVLFLAREAGKALYPNG